MNFPSLVSTMPIRLAPKASFWPMVAFDCVLGIDVRAHLCGLHERAWAHPGVWHE